MVEHVGNELGYLIFVESPEGPSSMDRTGHDIKSVAVWIMDNFGYFLSHDTMREIEKITSYGGVATVAVDREEEGVTGFEFAVVHAKGHPVNVLKGSVGDSDV